MDNLNKSPKEYREYILNMLVITAGSWQVTGCKDKALEKRFNSLLNQLHPVRETALAILQQHLALEVAA